MHAETGFRAKPEQPGIGRQKRVNAIFIRNGQMQGIIAANLPHLYFFGGGNGNRIQAQLWAQTRNHQGGSLPTLYIRVFCILEFQNF
ncbi:MAG: hypothetical protein A3G34_07365 [Candidatus Lindowbacteria bacterium RIFCSPLOWO2_12_FULL_62_27]|nr:MAG: hypothetical protein A3G34_07365 [Candidatus Lindowbacteria bacterium RIFCSPLOWO2_12_FULL_62_27]OGH61889.1 MAG: hypothetical protein A3I06_09060 [Candidatus Lindowbacteria bacterium RIFCSPLOWO2_02_FULL_62_12]